ncbi:hypothetical protein N7510_000658 [Penicillium lagena]|uniref:uncharacterized protein n=1 Tax=Penicillium lagena TaxID=94218 RepID=UPI002540337C|nr:uncharacterized protein N7510_000658 [Penicillium lagena]KAJ5624349.1 hypothetical protein N7510_000658 [Penicillium lagena]
MISSPGAPDVLTLATFAYQIFDTYQGAPKRFKGLCDDISGLDSKVATLSVEYADLENLVQQTGRLLEQLQKRQGSGLTPRGLHRFKCPDQERVLDKLDDILISIQEGRRPSSLMSTVDTVMMTPPSDEDDMWQELVREMHTYGISEAEANENRPMILKWAAKAAAAGILEEQRPSNLSHMVTGLQRRSDDFEVLSAVYGPLNVADTVRHIFRAHLRVKVPKISFTATNETFGGDPWLNNVKAFSMVWRKAIYLDYGTLYTAPQKVIAEEGETIIIDLNAPLPYHECFDDNPGSVHILIASWHNQDVTEQVAKVARTYRKPSIMASVHEFGCDPCFGHVKNLSVTWAYSDTPAALSYCDVKTVHENENLDIPPFLDIICANWGGLDITSVLQAQIGPHQTLQLDTNGVRHIASPDPWPDNHHKTISVLYQIGDGYRRSTKSIPPKPLFSSKNGPSAKIEVLAVVWGLHPVSEVSFIQVTLQNKQIPCNNTFFARDGWVGMKKTCQVFLQNNLTGDITCIVGREGTTLTLPTVWPGEDGAEDEEGTCF